MIKNRLVNPVCPYCGSTALLESSEKVYGGRDYGKLWVCGRYPECDSYVGCHERTEKPLGTLANKELRKWHRNAHFVFDRYWREGFIGRKDLYERLAKALGIPVEECHIGMFDIEICKKVIGLCNVKIEGE